MGKQVFQTDNKSRWTKFKWGTRVVLIVAGFLVAVFVTMLIIDNIPSLPYHKDYRSAVSASRPLMQETRVSREYKGFRSYISERKSHGSSANYAREKAAKLRSVRRFPGSATTQHRQYVQSWGHEAAGIRAGFYVAWDPKSYVSLRRNIRNLNLIMPEWLFINPDSDRLSTNIDARGLELMRRSGIPIMPMLSNNFHRTFRGDAVRRILHNPQKRRALIDSVTRICLRNRFIGINLDFEELREDTDEYLTQFVRELAATLHRNGLLLSQDVEPFNDDYNVQELARHVDYLVLMAYDEYSMSSDAGPISSQKWIEAAVDHIAKTVPNEKIILGMAAFGYDWTDGADGNTSLTYQQALSKASESASTPQFDGNTYNLSYAFRDEQNALHQVYFTDAATTFNVMRFGSEYGLAGFGLWRLGSEDDRIWNYYAQDMQSSMTSDRGREILENVAPYNGINYLGDGEVLDVMRTPQPGEIRITMDDTNRLIAEEQYIQIPTAYQIMKYGQAGNKELLLTFDDGPDERWTPQILDILKKHHIKAAFFLVGLQAERNLPIVKRIYNEGHLIGNHTFTHRNVANNSPSRTYMELKLTRLLIECITGHSTVLFRPPYNADCEPANMEELIPVVLAREQNYIDVGESVDPNDWEPGIKADEIVRRVTTQIAQGKGHIILLHDAGGETRKETIKALARIIDYYEQRGYTFTTLESLLGKNRNQLMPDFGKGKEYYAMQSNLALITITYDIIKVLTALFLVFIVLGFARLVFMVVLTVRERYIAAHRLYPTVTPTNAPRVSIIVPAYNEEVDAVASLENLLRQDYPNFDIIFVDDGSSDSTYQRVQEALRDNSKIKIYTKPNGGKASALNFGIAHTDAEYLVCIDADTKLYSNAVRLLMRHFMGEGREHIGAVAGNVKVGNQINMLTRWQAIEYTTSQNFDRLAYSAINAITVVPGAIGAFRKQAVEQAGGLTTDTLAEDCDLTIRILRAGYVVENENDAVAMTEAPEHLQQFIKQRVRWCFGIMQTFWKNRDALLTRKHKGLGMWALPNMLVFQFIIPTFSPLADLFMLIGLFSGNAAQIFVYYLIFTLIDASVSIVAYLFERDKLWVLLWIIPQRFCYRWIMYVVLYKSYKRAIKGELQTWGVLKRSGNVGNVAQ